MEIIMKLVVVLFLLLLFAVVALLAQVLYILWCRRRRCGRDSPTADPEIAAGAGGPSSKWVIAHLRCWKNNSRVEPAAASAEKAVEKGEDENGDAVIWRAMCYGPSRVLYTIKEEEREGPEAEVEVVVVDGEDEDDMEFSTPRASLEFYSPARSPNCFAAVERGGDL